VGAVHKDIYKGGEDAAYATFCKLRWPQTDGEAVCPRCGCCETYDITTRRRFKCVACGHQFSVTSGTIFASRKMAFVDLLAAICMVANGAKGIAALQLARDLDCQHKTAFVLCHKLREAMAAEIAAATELHGDVEIDGAHFGGTIRPANFKADRIDRRRVQSPRRRVVIAMRERKGVTRTFVVKHEAEGVELAKRHVSRMARVHADEASHWDALHAGWQVSRINHSEAYSDLLDACTNQAESFFSRLRRMVEGPAPHRQPAVPSPVRRTCRLAGKQPSNGQWRVGASRARQRTGQSCQPSVEGVLAACGLGAISSPALRHSLCYHLSKDGPGTATHHTDRFQGIA
jgi:transposase-like protein